jgi:hypothetical protein
MKHTFFFFFLTPTIKTPRSRKQHQDTQKKKNMGGMKSQAQAESCCVIDQSQHKCVDLAYDDQHCAKLAECCVGMHDAGLQNQCLSRVRECRKLGNAFDPIRPLKPMDTRWLFNDAPGYTTQGQLVLENFGVGGALSFRCVVKSMFCALFIGVLVRYFFKTQISTEQLVGISALAGVVRCMLTAMH